MTLSQFSEKYGIAYSRVIDSIRESDMYKRRHKNYDYDESKMCDAVIMYMKKREQQYLDKSNEFKNYAERVSTLKTYFI